MSSAPSLLSRAGPASRGLRATSVCPQPCQWSCTGTRPAVSPLRRWDRDRRACRTSHRKSLPVVPWSRILKYFVFKLKNNVCLERMITVIFLYLDACCQVCSVYFIQYPFTGTLGQDLPSRKEPGLQSTRLVALGTSWSSGWWSGLQTRRHPYCLHCSPYVTRENWLAELILCHVPS